MGPFFRVRKHSGRDAENTGVMPRPLRFVPPNSVVEVTARTVGSRFLLRPDATTNELVLGVIGRAQHLSGVRIFAVAVMSNHFHALVGVDHAAQLANFMQQAMSNIAKEVGRHHRWPGPFWARRYRSIVVADDASEIIRLRYVLCQGLKEGLVDRVERWPGVSSLRALVQGVALRGVWHNRTYTYEARRRGEKPDPAKSKTHYEVQLSQLPSLADMPARKYRALVASLVREEERAVRSQRCQEGKNAVLGARHILLQEPHDAPVNSDRGPAPFVHAISKAVRFVFRAAYDLFVDAFRLAAAHLRCGQPADFPEGAFPPRAPFVEAEASPA